MECFLCGDDDIDVHGDLILNKIWIDENDGVTAGHYFNGKITQH